MEFKITEIIRGSLTKLEKAHGFYIKANVSTQLLLIKQCEFIFKRLEENGIPRTFSESLLIWGKEFLLAEYGDEEEKLFGAFKEEVSEDKQKEIDEARSQGMLVWTKDSNGKLVCLVNEKKESPQSSDNPGSGEQRTLL